MFTTVVVRHMLNFVVNLLVSTFLIVVGGRVTGVSAQFLIVKSLGM